MRYHLIMHISYLKSNSRNTGYTNSEPKVATFLSKHISHSRQARPKSSYDSQPQAEQIIIPVITKSTTATYKMPKFQEKMVSLVSYSAGNV